MQSALDFLRDWMSDNALAQSRGPEDIDTTVRELAAAAVAYGIASADLSVAAGGDLRGHVKAAIELWSGETE